jgi:hypothetical protein
MDRELLALAAALAYPEEAFDPHEPDAPGDARALVAAAAAGKDMSADVRAFLASHMYLNDWVRRVLEHPRLLPPHLRLDEVRGDEASLPAHEPMADPFVCEVDGWIWYRVAANQSIPDCPFRSDSPADASRHRLTRMNPAA